MTRLYLLYDERAMDDTDDAMVLCAADTIEEAREDAEMFGNCVIFSYNIAKGGVLNDERFEEYIIG